MKCILKNTIIKIVNIHIQGIFLFILQSVADKNDPCDVQQSFSTSHLVYFMKIEKSGTCRHVLERDLLSADNNPRIYRQVNIMRCVLISSGHQGHSICYTIKYII